MTPARQSARAIAAAVCAMVVLTAGPAPCATPNATIEGDLSNTLRESIRQAVGETRTPPENGLAARRRARQAQTDAIALLRSEGYYESQVEPDISATNPPRAIVRVVPGPRFHLSGAALEWVGSPPIAPAASAASLALHIPPGAPGRAEDVLAAEGRVVGALQKLGYADAEARPRKVLVDHADQSVQPTFHIAAGDAVRLDGLKVTAKGRTRAAWLRRLAPWKRGALYDPAKVAKLEQRLLETGVYESVTVSLAPKDQTVDGLRPVIVGVADRPAHTIELSASYSATGVAVTAYTPTIGSGTDLIGGSGIDGKYILYNRLGRADTLTFAAKLYDIQQKLDAELALPDWGRPDQTLRVGGGLLADRTAAYDEAGGGVRLEVERRFTKTTFITLGGALDYAATREKNAINPLSSPAGVDLKLFIVTGQAAFALDRSNDPLNPTRGWRLEARVEPTSVNGDRNLIFLRTQAQASAYLPLRPDGATVFAGRIKLGSIVGGSIPGVPAARRFYAGGGGSVRGYGYQAVGPRLSDNTPEGGLSLAEGSLEVRQRIGRQFGLVGFVDAGAVGTSSTPDFRDFSAGVGLGLRYDLGFGPLRLDIATPINRRRGDSLIQVYISIGQSF